MVPRQHIPHRGFALLTVLFDLAIITMLLALSLPRFAAQSLATSQERLFLEDRALVAGVAQVSGVNLAAQLDGRSLQSANEETLRLGDRAVHLTA